MLLYQRLVRHRSPAYFCQSKTAAMNWYKDDCRISTDKSLLNIPYIHHYLSTQSYWAEGIPLWIVERSIKGSLCFGIYREQQQIGFARVITDEATFAYLADVFIDASFRGQGLSKWLMEVIMAHPDLQPLRRFMLATMDAHGLYRQYGFTPISKPDRWMEIAHLDLYKNMGDLSQ